MAYYIPAWPFMKGNSHITPALILRHCTCSDKFGKMIEINESVFQVLPVKEYEFELKNQFNVESFVNSVLESILF